MICAKSEYSNLGHNVCYGGSGGPLICKEEEEDENVLQGMEAFSVEAKLEDVLVMAVYSLGLLLRFLTLNGG